MRVIAGTARSLPLKAPEGTDTRPTTDRIKETLFNILQPYLPGSVFMDLFSGSGGIGIEALSRGAGKAYFVENASKAISCIQQNLLFTKMQDRAIVLKQEVCSALCAIRDRRLEERVDIIFMDPPYNGGYETTVLAALGEMPYVTGETMIIIETSINAELAELSQFGFALTREKCYKTNKYIFLKRISI